MASIIDRIELAFCVLTPGGEQALIAAVSLGLYGTREVIGVASIGGPVIGTGAAIAAFCIDPRPERIPIGDPARIGW